MARHGGKNAVKAGKDKFLDYAQNLNPSYLDGTWGDKKWSKMHGDGKSSTTGVTYRGELQKTSNGTFLVRILNGNVAFRQLEYSQEPSFLQVGNDLKAGRQGKLN